MVQRSISRMACNARSFVTSDHRVYRRATQTERVPFATMADLWISLDRIIETAPNASALRTHGLGPIAAARLRQRGEQVPDDIDRLARGAVYASITAAPLLQKVIDVLQEPVVLLKGPEVARFYPERTMRTYGDLDLLVSDYARAERKLIEAGFAELIPNRIVEGQQHDSPLGLSNLALMIELHRHPGWLRWLTPPSEQELRQVAIPSVTGVDGAFALPPEHLVLFLASHAWRHNPYHSLIHLVDIELVRQQTDPERVTYLAKQWGIEPVWNHLCAMIDWFIYQQNDPPGIVHRWWARHFDEMREQTLFEFYLGNWGRGLAAPTHSEQFESVIHDIRFRFSTHSWQNRRHKLKRIYQGARGLNAPSSRHLKSG